MSVLCDLTETACHEIVRVNVSFLSCSVLSRHLLEGNSPSVSSLPTNCVEPAIQKQQPCNVRRGYLSAGRSVKLLGGRGFAADPTGGAYSSPPNP